MNSRDKTNWMQTCSLFDYGVYSALFTFLELPISLNYAMRFIKSMRLYSVIAMLNCGLS